MGQRSRKRRRAREAPATTQAKPAAIAAPAPKRTPAPARASRSERTEARNAAARAALEPLAAGERPGAVTVAAVVALLLAAANIALAAAGVEVRNQHSATIGVVVFSVLMLAAAGGMWMRRYWAVLGFQALLGVSIAIAALSLTVASNAAAVGLCLAIILPGGFLFWKLVRAMARIQMPQRPSRG